MLRRTSKKVKELVDKMPPPFVVSLSSSWDVWGWDSKMRPPSVVCLSSSWDVWGWDDYVRNGTIYKKLKPIFTSNTQQLRKGWKLFLGSWIRCRQGAASPNSSCKKIQSILAIHTLL